MSRSNGVKLGDKRRLLVGRIASSRYLSRSVRLRDMLLYLSERVLEDHAAQIHEHEVGHKIFGRPVDYDTMADNIVRVHASMLRKRLEQYFSSEGADEPLILEIPKGNYAPVFRERSEADAESIVPSRRNSRGDWRIGALAAAAIVLACSTVFMWLRPPRAAVQSPGHPAGPMVRVFWSQIFRPNQTTDIVLDDAAVGLYQRLAGLPLNLSDYFDRDYLRTLPETTATAQLNKQTAASIVLPRQTSYSSASFLWRILRMPGAAEHNARLYFARDYSFRALKADNAVLLGNSRSNPWVQLFEGRVGLRWVYDKAAGVYYPEDSWAGATAKKFSFTGPDEARAEYCAISLLPNLNGNGNVLIISGTGGSAIDSGADFLANEQDVSRLRQRLPAARNNLFPYFEALLSVKRRSTMPREVTIMVCRSPRR